MEVVSVKTISLDGVGELFEARNGKSLFSSPDGSVDSVMVRTRIAAVVAPPTTSLSSSVIGWNASSCSLIGENVGERFVPRLVPAVTMLSTEGCRIERTLRRNNVIRSCNFCSQVNVRAEGKR